MTTDATPTATIPAASAAPFTPTEARSVADNVRRMTTADLTIYRTRAHRVIGNYRGVPTATATADVTRANRVADTIDAELTARGRDARGTITRGTVTIDIAAASTDPTPATTDDGGVVVGMALGVLGFADIVTMRSGVMIADHHAAGVRVFIRPDNITDAITVRTNGNGVAPYDVTFTDDTPAGVVVAAIAAVVAIGTR